MIRSYNVLILKLFLQAFNKINTSKKELQSFEDPHDLTVSPKATWPAHSSRRKLISGLCFLRMARCSRLRPHLSLTFAYRLQLSSFFRSSRDPSSTAWNTLFTYAWAGRKGHVIYFFFGRKKLSSLKNNAFFISTNMWDVKSLNKRKFMTSDTISLIM